MRLEPPTVSGLILLMAGAVLILSATATSLGVAVVKFLVAALVVTVVHVLAYVIVARSVGLPLYAVLLGGGPRLVGARMGQLTVELRALPVGGSVTFYPERSLDADDDEPDPPPPQSVIMTLLAGPLASVVVAAALLGSDVASAVGLLPAQIAAVMFDPGGRGLDVAWSALQLTESTPQVVVGTVAAKLGLLQIPANGMLLVGATVRLAGGKPGSGLLLTAGLIQVALTTWVLFGFVYGLALALEGP